MSNGIFAPMFDPAVEAYADDLIDEQKRGKTREQAIEEAERKITNAGTVERDLLIERVIREWPATKRWLGMQFRDNITSPLKNHTHYRVDKTENYIVGFVAMVARQIYHDELKQREVLHRLGHEEPLGPVRDDNARAKALNSLYHKYQRRIVGAFARLRVKIGAVPFGGEKHPE